MEIQFNHRGNGACPLCRKNGRCLIHGRIRQALKETRDPGSSGMEFVVYGCPLFDESV